MTKIEALACLKSIINVYWILVKNQINSEVPLDNEDLEAIDMAIKALSAEPIRSKGLWKIHDAVRHLYRCSECQSIMQIRFNFCPNCGADMRGKE